MLLLLGTKAPKLCLRSIASDLLLRGAVRAPRHPTHIVVALILSFSHLSLGLEAIGIRDLEVCLLVINHIFAEVEVEQTALLTVNRGFALQLVAFTLESRLKLLLRIRAINVPIYPLNFLLENAILVVWICAILNLLDDTLRVRLHECTLRHAHGHHLLVGGRVATDTVV